MQSNDLVSENVVPRGNAAGDPHAPRVAILSQGAIGVFPRSALRDEAHPVNLEELERRLVHSLTWTVAVGQVIDHRPAVIFRPRRPLYGDCIAGSDLDMPLSWDGVTMADDVGVTVLVRGNKTIVSLLDGPAEHDWGLSLERKACAEVSPIGDAVDDDLGDMAVC